MAHKPEIQYVGQFYVFGSEARALAAKRAQKQAQTQLPDQAVQQVRQVRVDVLAVASLVLAGVLLVTMVAGALSMQTAWQDLRTAKQYVYELEAKNRVLTVEYRSSYDLEEIRSAALSLGMIPAEEAEIRSFTVTMPVQEPEPTFLENLQWFLKGLFA